MNCAETAKLIDLLFGLWTWVGQRKPMCCHGWGHLRHVAITIEAAMQPYVNLPFFDLFFLTTSLCLPIVLVFCLFTALPED